MTKIPRNGRKGTKASLRRICRRLGLPFRNSKVKANKAAKGVANG